MISATETLDDGLGAGEAATSVQDDADCRHAHGGACAIRRCRLMRACCVCVCVFRGCVGFVSLLLFIASLFSFMVHAHLRPLYVILDHFNSLTTPLPVVICVVINAEGWPACV